MNKNRYRVIWFEEFGKTIYVVQRYIGKKDNEDRWVSMTNDGTYETRNGILLLSEVDAINYMEDLKWSDSMGRKIITRNSPRVCYDTELGYLEE